MRGSDENTLEKGWGTKSTDRFVRFAWFGVGSERGRERAAPPACVPLLERTGIGRAAPQSKSGRAAPQPPALPFRG